MKIILDDGQEFILNEEEKTALSTIGAVYACVSSADAENAAMLVMIGNLKMKKSITKVMKILGEIVKGQIAVGSGKTPEEVERETIDAIAARRGVSADSLRRMLKE